jgi:hypothetical protein
MSEVQVMHSFGDVTWFVRVEESRLAFAHCTEAAMTRADVAAEHEGRGAIGPTFKNVWTTSFLANCMQVKTFDELQHLVLISRVAQADA